MKTYSAGALLFTIITAFVLSLLVATLMLVVINHGRTINSEINRTIAFYRAQAGMEYAIWWAYNNSGSLPVTAGTFVNVPGGTTIPGINQLRVYRLPALAAGFQTLSTYGIQVRANYES